MAIKCRWSDGIVIQFDADPPPTRSATLHRMSSHSRQRPVAGQPIVLATSLRRFGIQIQTA